MKSAAKDASNAEVHVHMGVVNALCLCPVDFPTSLSFHLMEVICVRSLFSGMNLAVYVVSHFDYCRCTHLWSHRAGEMRSCLQTIYSILGPD